MPPNFQFHFFMKCLTYNSSIKFVLGICDKPEHLTEEHTLVKDFFTGNGHEFIINKSFCDRDRIFYDIPKAIFSEKSAYDIVTEDWGH